MHCSHEEAQKKLSEYIIHDRLLCDNDNKYIALVILMEAFSFFVGMRHLGLAHTI